MDHAAFLATLGGIWLEHGDATQALIWLERSLLLEPLALGARADHALALAALGERDALVELTRQWRDRVDIPGALQSRLIAALANRSGSGPIDPAARPASFNTWTWRRELGVFYGRETNLDHSPRLSELTLTGPDFTATLPLVEALVPRAGAAWLAEGSIHANRPMDADSSWHLGLQFSGRQAPSQRATDQHNVRLFMARTQSFAQWRGQLLMGWGWQGGSLGEPYQTWRIGAGADHKWASCDIRLGLDFEWRRHPAPSLSNGQTTALQGNADCAAPWPSHWTWGLALRAANDAPDSPERPGQTQRLVALGLRAAGPIGAGMQLELTARISQSRDREGYSPLLSNNAIRRQSQQHLSIELSRPIAIAGSKSAEIVAQLQQLGQSSNLALFEHRGATFYAGFRLGW